MSVNRMPLWLGLASFALLIALVLGLQPYSVTSPWSRYDKPGQRFLVAALRRDTAVLKRLSASPGPVEWALRTEQTERNALAAWANSARASVAFERGDSTDVLYDTPTSACPFLLTFVDQTHPRILRAQARCYMRRGWPSDPSVIAVSQ
jgi:hypothetical protein